MEKEKLIKSIDELAKLMKENIEIFAPLFKSGLKKEKCEKKECCSKNENKEWKFNIFEDFNEKIITRKKIDNIIGTFLEKVAEKEPTIISTPFIIKSETILFLNKRIEVKEKDIKWWEVREKENLNKRKEKFIYLTLKNGEEIEINYDNFFNLNLSLPKLYKQN